jgi:hypothetical protein
MEEGDARQCLKYTFLPLYYVCMMPLEVGLSGGYLKGPNLEHIFNEKLNLYPQSNLTQKKLSCKLSFMFVKLYFMTKREKVEGAKKVLHHIPMKEL